MANLHRETCRKLPRSVGSSVVAAHGHDRRGLPSPYYDAENVLRHVFALQLGPHYGAMVCDDPIQEDFNRHSFTLWSLVLLATRRGLRRLVKERWPEITEILREEFVWQRPWQGLLWQADGRQESSFPSDTQSWAALKAEAEEATKGRGLPRYLGRVPELLPLYTAAFPHRFRPCLMLNLDKMVDEAIAAAY